MKIKYAILVLCIAMMTFLFAGCVNEDKDDNGGPTQTCTHSYVDGVCELCGEEDPDYNTEDENGDGNGEQKPDDEPDTPPIDMGGETELPFVPAK